MKRIVLLLTAVFIIFVSAGCSSASHGATIAATTLPVYEFTSLLCQGTDIGVTRLITEEVTCLHDYTLQVRQMRSLEQAELVVISGAGLEDFLGGALHTTNNILDASRGISLQCNDGDHDHGGHGHEEDPHIWLSPENARQMAHNIYDGLINHYPQHSQIFSENLTLLDAKFDGLIQYAEAELENISYHELITFHDGFSYMAEAFDLTILHAIEEESGSEASAAELIELINIVSAHGVHAIFTEKNSSSAGASIVAAEAGTAIYDLDMALSGDSYFTAMYHNIDTLKEALK